MINAQPIARRLRFLQTMGEISSEHNTTTFLPIPIDLFTPFLEKSIEELAGNSEAECGVPRCDAPTS